MLINKSTHGKGWIFFATLFTRVSISRFHPQCPLSTTGTREQVALWGILDAYRLELEVPLCHISVTAINLTQHLTFPLFDKSKKFNGVINRHFLA